MLRYQTNDCLRAQFDLRTGTSRAEKMFQYCHMRLVVMLCATMWAFWLSFQVSLFFMDDPNSEPACCPPSATSKPVTDQWILQKLDHFNSTNTATWKQRYRVNQGRYENNAPIFLSLGAKCSLPPDNLYEELWTDYANAFNALFFHLEHRYFGKSRPTKDLSTENLAYLTVDQALADTSTFIVQMQKKYDIPAKAKWVVLGCSYPGALATWMRIKYPHLVHAAVSTGSPTVLKIDFTGYYQAIEKTIVKYNPECATQIKQANQMINDHLKTTDGKKMISKKFELCEPLDELKNEGFESLFDILAQQFSQPMSYNKIPFFGKIYGNLPWEKLCDIMVNSSIATPLDRYATAQRLVLSDFEWNKTCTDYRYSKIVDRYSDISWDNNAFEGHRQWAHLSCNQLGLHKSSTENSVFGNHFPFEYYLKRCADVFGSDFSLEKLSASVNKINAMYGESEANDSRIISILGSTDPWRVLGLTRKLSEKSVLIYVNGTSNCADIYQAFPYELPQLHKARRLIKVYLSEWLKNDFDDSKPAIHEDLSVIV